METGDLRMRVSEIQWFHIIDLGHGVVTPGVDDTPRKLAKIAMPSDLSGQSVLDIGAWDGFFAFEGERRGARRVLATDSFCWSGQAWGTKRGFELARQVLESQVEDRLIDVMDLSPAKVGMFDLVLFLGGLYHLRHPLLALEKVFSVTGRHLILETEVSLFTLGSNAGTTSCSPRTDYSRVGQFAGTEPASTDVEALADLPVSGEDQLALVWVSIT